MITVDEMLFRDAITAKWIFELNWQIKSIHFLRFRSSIGGHFSRSDTKWVQKDNDHLHYIKRT